MSLLWVQSHNCIFINYNSHILNLYYISFDIFFTHVAIWSSGTSCFDFNSRANSHLSYTLQQTQAIRPNITNTIRIFVSRESTVEAASSPSSWPLIGRLRDPEEDAKFLYRVILKWGARRQADWLVSNNEAIASGFQPCHCGYSTWPNVQHAVSSQVQPVASSMSFTSNPWLYNDNTQCISWTRVGCTIVERA